MAFPSGQNSSPSAQKDGEEEGGPAAEKEEKEEGEGEQQPQQNEDEDFLLEDVESRVVTLVDVITKFVFMYCNRGLFERHKLTFAVLLALKVLVRQKEQGGKGEGKRREK